MMEECVGVTECRGFEVVLVTTRVEPVEEKIGTLTPTLSPKGRGRMEKHGYDKYF
jgi:hypothetical protein